MRVVIMFLVGSVAAWPLWAQDQGARALLDALAERTPGATLSEMRGDPDGFWEEAAGVVLGYGSARGIDAAGLEDAVAAGRARVRARELRRLLQADLNADLTVDAREIDVAIRTASASMRGRLMNWHMQADVSGDGSVSWGEMRAFADAVSIRTLSEVNAEAMRALMVFDLDGDRWVTVSELRRAIDLLRAPA